MLPPFWKTTLGYLPELRDRFVEENKARLITVCMTNSPFFIRPTASRDRRTVSSDDWGSGASFTIDNLMDEEGNWKRREVFGGEYGCTPSRLVWNDIQATAKEALFRAKANIGELRLSLTLVKKKHLVDLFDIREKGSSIYRRLLLDAQNHPEADHIQRWEERLDARYSHGLWKKALVSPWYLPVEAKQRELQLKISLWIAGTNNWVSKFDQTVSPFCERCLSERGMEVKEDVVHRYYSCPSTKMLLIGTRNWLERCGWAGLEVSKPFKILLYNYEFTGESDTTLEKNLVWLWVKYYVKAAIYVETPTSVRKCTAYMLRMIKEYIKIHGNKFWERLSDLERNREE